LPFKVRIDLHHQQRAACIDDGRHIARVLQIRDAFEYARAVEPRE